MKSFRIAASLLVLSVCVSVLPALAQDDLTETFITSDGSLTLNYPTGWHVEEAFVSGVVFVGTTSTAVDTLLNPDADFVSGDAVVMIVTPQASLLIFEEVVPASLDEAVALMIADDDPDDEFGEPESATIAGHDALMFSALSPASEGVGIAVDVADEYLLISAQTVAGEYDQVADTVLAIVETLIYAQPEGMVPLEGQGIRFEYPAGWTTFEVVAGSYMVVNDMAFDTVPDSGQVVLLITAPGSLFIYGEYDDTDATTLALDFVEAFAFGDDSEITFSEPEDVTIGPYEGARVTYTSSGGEGMVIVLAVDNRLVTVGVAAAPGELSDFDADILRIVETIALPARE